MVRRITLLCVLVGCGGNSLDDCNQLLEQSDVHGAADCFAHVDGPQGAFGYGLTRLILWPDQAPVQHMMQALGQPAWDPATQVFGPSGWMHDVMHSWSGTASLAVDGTALALDRVRAGIASDGSITIYVRSTSDPNLRVTIFHQPGVNYVDVEGPSLSTFGSGTVNLVQGATSVTATVDVMLQSGAHLTGTITAPFASCLALDRRVPFQNLRGTGGWDAAMLKLLSDGQSGTTLATIFDNLAATAPYLDEVAQSFEKAAATPDFQFVIPKGLFFGARDLVVRRPEAALLAATVRWMQFWVTFLDAYDWNISGPTLSALTDSLNAHFFNVADPSKLAASRDAFAKAAQNMSTALDAMAAEGTAPAGALSQWHAGTGFDFLRSLATLLGQVPAGSAAIPNTSPATQLDFSGMFGAQPLDGKTLDHDPFVYEAGGYIAGVEGFWRDLLTGRFTPDFVMSMSAPAFPSPNPFGGNDIVSMPADTQAQLQLFTTATSLGCN